MAYKFMSDEWFKAVAEIIEEANVEIPEDIQDLAINVTATSDAGNKTMCINAGMIQKDHEPHAQTTLTLPMNLCKKLFIEQDQAAGMQAFISGSIKVEGDMSRMMALNNVDQSEAQEAVTQKIIEITD